MGSKPHKAAGNLSATSAQSPTAPGFAGAIPSLSLFLSWLSPGWSVLPSGSRSCHLHPSWTLPGFLCPVSTWVPGTMKNDRARTLGGRQRPAGTAAHMEAALEVQALWGQAALVPTGLVGWGLFLSPQPPSPS